MVFIGGPRQVGKTYLSLQFLHPPTVENPAYVNWDTVEGKRVVRQGILPPAGDTIVLDEIHKYARWRNLVKGWYDKHRSRLKIIVTGSAKLDVYRKGGDSLVGRYHSYRLHPLSLREISATPTATDVAALLELGGFPEPFFKGSATFRRRWQKERIERVTNQDVRDLENIRDLSLLQLLVDALPERVGSPLSVRSLREDLEVAHDTVERWLKILENVYYCFRIPPYGAPKIRAVKKEQKLYLWDHAEIAADGPRFENMVASQLLKYCHYLEDTQGFRMELRFLRDVDKREIDFVVLQDKKPVFAVECKTGEKNVSPAIGYFAQRTRIERYFQVHRGARDYLDAKTGARVLPFQTFCRELRLP
jgi:predicted AAA+ superfamily ATPase